MEANHYWLEAFGRRGSLTLSIILLLAGCSQEVPPPAEVVRTVKTMAIGVGKQTSVRTFPGKVEASQRVQLAFQVPGILKELPVREGQTVSKDDLIAQLRQDEFQSRLKSAQGELDRAEADLQAARAGVRPEERKRLEAEVRSAEAVLANERKELDRSNQLLRRQVISRAENDRAKTAFRVAQENNAAAQQTLNQGITGREEYILAREADVRNLKARVQEANLQLKDSTLKAPYDGVIAQRFVEPGQNIPAKEPVVMFQDFDEIEVAVDIPEAVMAAELRSADIVKIVAVFSAAPGRHFPVHIKEIAQRADPTTQTFLVRVAMKAPKDVNILPGMTATVTITSQRASLPGGRILVPTAAVVEESAGAQSVWMLGEDGTVTRHPVKPGTVTGGSIEILEGLKAGDRIVVAGLSFLHDGMKVRDLGNGLD